MSNFNTTIKFIIIDKFYEATVSVTSKIAYYIKIV